MGRSSVSTHRSMGLNKGKRISFKKTQSVGKVTVRNVRAVIAKDEERRSRRVLTKE